MQIRYQLFEERENAVVKNVAFCAKEAVLAMQISAGGSRLVCCSYTTAFDPPCFALGPVFAEHKLDAQSSMSWSFSSAHLFVVAGKGFTTFSLATHLSSPSLHKSDYFEDKAEILCLAPGRDDAEVFYGTLDGKVVKLRKRELAAQRQFENKVIALMVDPLRRHVGVLTLENVFAVCDYHSLQPDRVVDLSLRLGQGHARAQLVIREDRKIDASPDLQTVLLPSLEDKKLPLALALGVERGFAVEAVFGGSFAPITVIRFLPAVLTRQEQPFAVFAMGDAHGNVTFWELTGAEKPLFLLKSDDVSVTIENIDFSPDARVMIAVTNRKFFITALLTPGLFGAESAVPKAEYVRDLFDYDLRDFRPVSYKDMRAREERREVCGAVAARKVGFRKKGEAGPREEPAAVEKAPEPRPARRFFARGKCPEELTLPVGEGFLALSNKEGKGVLRLWRGGAQCWKSGGFGAVSHLVCSDRFVLLANDSDAVFFLDLSSGMRCRRKLLFPNLFDVQISRAGLAVFVNTYAEFFLYDVSAEQTVCKASMESLLLRELAASGAEEKPETIFNAHSLRFAVNGRDQLIVFLLDSVYQFDAELRAWRVGSLGGDAQATRPLDEWKDPMSLLFTMFAAETKESIGDLEEKLLTAAHAQDQPAFAEAMKEYFINLAQNGDHERLKTYLLHRILLDETSVERAHLQRLGVQPQTIVRNALNLVKHFDNSTEFVRFFETYLM